MLSRMKKEIAIMVMIKHKFVVQIREVIASNTKIFIVLEYLSNGTLLNKVMKEGKFSEVEPVLYEPSTSPINLA